jgi:hypothetical protein
VLIGRNCELGRQVVQICYTGDVMNCSPRVRLVRIGTLVVCLVLFGLWILGYWWANQLSVQVTESRYFSLGAGAGFIAVSTSTMSPGSSWTSTRTDQLLAIYARGGTLHPSRVWGTFGYFADGNATALLVPIWLLVLLTVMLASAAPWIVPRIQFGLGTMIIATTLIAAVLGVISVALR